ncbi:MAG: RdgB/HAM1 family non-canonical purine NTP pyrophosphatase [Oscillospiraceae bacterium]|jgi:XTP/dITP diphosphohydrolase
MKPEYRRIAIATGNRGKVREIEEILAPLGYDVFPISDLGVTLEDPETGKTFFENARIKAREGVRKTGMPVIADDSGLCVDYLGGGPGVHTARYAGEHPTADENMDKLLGALKDVPWEDRTARFKCAIVFLAPDGTEITARGSVEGRIGFEKRGTGGFGYNPVFCVQPGNFTMAEMSDDRKNSVSHRGRALRRLAFKMRGISRIRLGETK